MTRPVTFADLNRMTAALLVALAAFIFWKKTTDYDIGWASRGQWRLGVTASHAVGLLALRLADERIREQQREAAEREAIRSATVDDCVRRGGWPVEGLALYTVCIKESATVK